MSNDSNRSALVTGTALLTVASLIAKILSAVYRIPFQNMVGNVGFYVYQQIYPIYGIAMTVALSGLPVFISKLVVDAKTETDKLNIVYQIQKILFIVCGLIFVGLQLGANQIAIWMHDIQLSPVIYAVSWMFLVIPFLASWRGYFQGRYLMKPTAYSQVLEQLVRVSIILVTAVWAVRHHLDPHRMGSLAMLSAPFATLASAGLIYYFLRKDHIRKLSRSYAIPGLSRRLLLEGATICLVASVMLLLQLVDSFSVVAELTKLGNNQLMAQNIKGVYDRSQTLVQLGLTITTASTTAILPQLVAAVKSKNQQRYLQLAHGSIAVNFGLACAMSFGMLALMAAINPLLFATPELNLTISVYCFSILAASIILVLNTIFQSHDVFGPTVIAIIIAVVIKAAVNSLFIDQWGILGASLATVSSLCAAILIMIVSGWKYLRDLISWSQLAKLVLISAIMWSAVIGVRILIKAILIGKVTLRIMAGIQSIVGIGVGVFVFVIVCIMFKAFSDQEWLLIPMGNRILEIRGNYNENR
ncbi:polysaccharide biosynthesis protein [Lentilactobacillus kosonis]|uniref:Low temperature requirement B protein n=1 Tax=Lentilactobacillus kosonis TaxID=2810561 RepID=A0A401FPN3_9LACO|nr:polysaccharide biosynthesis protein [Lentilactobacillus kosonis]GAY74171.1 low temperature requirement B protein [Lentilactobacillus kosonis]